MTDFGGVTLDTVDPVPNPRPRPGEAERRSHQVNARFDRYEYRALSDLMAATGKSATDLARAGILLLATGYPNLPPDVHDWLLGFARANDLGPDPNAAIVMLVRHLRLHMREPRRLAS